MKQSEMEQKQKLIAIAVVSAIYGLIIEITKDISFTTVNLTNLDIPVNLAIFVPAIASIIFGRTIGGLGAAGGQFINANIGGGGVAGALIPMLADFSGAFIVGLITKKPESEWDDFTTRFTSMATWSRLANNTLGTVVGFGLLNSLILGFGSTSDLATGSVAFVELFFINSILVLLFVPLTLILFELGDIFAEVRSHRKDKQLRKIAFKTPKESGVSIISAKLTERAFTKNVWTPLKVKFRNTTQEKTVFNIEAVSSANCHPSFDQTKALEPGEVWEQNFFILPSSQNKVDFKVRIVPISRGVVTNPEEDSGDTIMEMSGKTNDISSNSLMLVLFSAINSIMVGISLISDNLATVFSNIDMAIISLQRSGALLSVIAVIEIFVFVGVMYLIKRSTLLNILPETELTLAFGSDISSHKIRGRLEDEIGQFIEDFKNKILNTLKILLIMVTLVAILLLGLEGFNAGMYSDSDATEILLIGLGGFATFVIGYRGIELLKESGFLKEDKFSLEDQGPVQRFKPTTDFQNGIPNSVLFSVKNPTKNQGVRIQFLGYDTVSPPLLELNIPPGGDSQFKTSITPIAMGSRDILAITSPLYDEKGNYLDRYEVEPFAHQRISYQVQPETSIGISKEQEAKLKKLLIVVLAVVALVFGSGALLSDFLGASVTTLVQDNLPYLLALQAPFVYAYFYLQNQFKSAQMDIEDLLEQLSATTQLSNDINKKLSGGLGSAISGNIQNVIQSEIKHQFSKIAGDEISGQVQKIIQSEIGDILGSDLSSTINKGLQAKAEGQIMELIMGSITDNFAQQFQDISKQVMDSSTILKEALEQKEALAAQITERVHAVVPDVIEGSASDAAKEVLPTSVSEVKEINTDKITAQVKEEIKAEVKAQLKAQILEQMQTTIPKMFASNFSSTVIDGLPSNFTKDIEKQLVKQFDSVLNEELIDTIFGKVESLLDTTIKDQLMKEIQNRVADRRLTAIIAEELDEELGTNILTEFEEVIGTELEKEIGNKIKSKLEEKYRTEIKDKFNDKIKKQIKKQLKKQSSKILKTTLTDTLTNKAEEVIQKSMDTFTGERLEGFIDKGLDIVLDKTFDKIQIPSLS